MEHVGAFWAGALQHGTVREVERLLARLGPDDLESATPDDLMEAGVPRVRAERWARARAFSTRGVAVTALDPRYPSRLRRAEDAPPVVLVEGDVACLDRAHAVGIVGTRGCTAYGRSVARSLGAALAGAGAAVISGLARGIDAAAHAGALRGGTVAVLGHGLGHTAPPSHRRLRSQILEAGGAMVSTWPDEIGPARWTFPRRNRWIAALSDVVVVVEAPERSGALITAHQALELAADGPERDGPVVLIVPAPLGAPASAGGMRLLEEVGVGVVSSVEAVVREVCGVRTRAQVDWLAHLCAGASLDEVARLRGSSLLELVRDLTALELRGELVRLPGQRYARASQSRGAP